MMIMNRNLIFSAS